MALTRYTIAAGVQVTFVAPDMNWGDVRNVLMHGCAESLEDKRPVQKECTVELIDDVRAFTDTSSINYTVFILTGLAKVGLSRDAMSALFFAVRTLCRSTGIVEDPYVWPLLDRIPTTHPNLARRMLGISADPQMSEAFLSRESYDAVINERVLIRYQQK